METVEAKKRKEANSNLKREIRIVDAEDLGQAIKNVLANPTLLNDDSDSEVFFLTKYNSKKC